MSNAFNSFVGGLAGGYINETHRREDRDRQDKLDLMREEEFNLRKHQLEGQIGDQDLERSTKKAELEAGRDVNVEDGSALQVGGNLYDTDAESAANSAHAIEQANAQLSPQEQIPTGAAVQTKKVGVKRFLADSAGIAAATAYQTEANSEDGKVKSKAAVISDLRGPEAAQKFLTDWQDNKAKLYDAQRGALWNTVSSMAAQKDYKGIADAYEHYKDGNRLTFEPQPDGSVTATHLGKDGKPLGQFAFKTPTELQDKLYEAMYPDKLMEQRRAAEVKRQEELDKVHALSPGGELRTGAGGLVAKNNTLTVAEARAFGQGRYGGVGGGVGGGGGSEQAPGRMDYSQGVKFNDVYQKNLAYQLDRLKADPLTNSAPPTKAQEDQAAQKAYAMTAQQVQTIVSETQKSTQVNAIQRALAPLYSGRGADQGRYAGARAQLLDRGFSDATITSMGFPPPAGASSNVRDGKMVSRGTYAR